MSTTIETATAEVPPPPVKRSGRGPWRLVWDQLWAKGSARFGLVTVALLILLAVVAQAVASLGALWASLRAVARGGRPLGAALVLVDLLALLLVPTTMSAVAILLGNVLPSHFPAVTTALVHLAVCAAVAVAGIVALRHGRTGASSGGTTGGTPGGTTGSASTATAGSPASGAPPRPGADASAPSAPLTPGASSPVIPPRS